MSKTPVVIACVTLVLGVAVGAVAGYLLGAAAPVELPARATTDVAGAPVSAAPVDDAAPASRGGARPRVASRASPNVAAHAAAEAPAVGTGTIKGRVLGPDEAPLAGVLVRATPASDRNEDAAGDDEETRLAPGSPPPPLDVDRALEQYAAMLRRERAATREATTDAAGAFVLTGLVESPHAVDAWLAGYRIERLHANGYVPVGGRCDFKAAPTASLRVTVVLPDGTSPKSAQVLWKRTGDSDDSAWWWRRANPRIDLEPGSYVLTAKAGPSELVGGFSGEDGADAFTCEPQTVAVAAGAEQSLTLRLTGRPGVLARIVYDSPEHPRTVRVALLKLDAGGVADAARLLADGDDVKSQWLEGTTDATFSDLAPGTYLLGVTFRGGAVGPSTTVVVGADLVTRELRVAAGGIRDWIRVWVRAPGGALVRDVAITCGVRGSAGEESSGEGQASPEEDGSLRVEHFEGGASNSGSGRFYGGSFGRVGRGFHRQRAQEVKRTYFVRATSARYGNADATYDPAADREVTVQFTEPARLRATISGFADNPSKGRIALALRPRDGSERASTSMTGAKIDDAGIATLGPVVPGAYDVVVSLSAQDRGAAFGRHWDSWGATEVAKVPVTLSAGDNELVVAVPALTDLAATFDERDDVGNIRLQRLVAGGALEEAQWGVAAASGHEVVFANLPPGRYRLVAESGDMWANVPGDARVAFKPRPFNSLRATLFTENGGGGYLSEAGLQDGDVVVAVDAAACENALQIDALLAVARTHDAAKLTVMRADRRVEVAVDAKRLNDGGRLERWVR